MASVRIEFDEHTPKEIRDVLKEFLRRIGVDPTNVPARSWIEIGSNGLVEVPLVAQSPQGDMLFADQNSTAMAVGVAHIWRERLPDLTLALSTFKGCSSNKRNLLEPVAEAVGD